MDILSRRWGQSLGCQGHPRDAAVMLKLDPTKTSVCVLGECFVFSAWTPHLKDGSNGSGCRWISMLSVGVMEKRNFWLAAVLMALTSDPQAWRCQAASKLRKWWNGLHVINTEEPKRTLDEDRIKRLVFITHTRV